MGFQICCCKEEEACCWFCGHFSAFGSTGNLALKPGALLDVWLQKKVACMCVILSDSSTHCCFAALTAFLGSWLSLPKQGCPSDPETLGKSKLGAGVCSTAKLGLADLQQCFWSQPQLVPLATFLEFHFSAALSL